MAVGIREKKTIFFSLTEHCTHKTRLASSEGGKERARFLLPPSLKSLLDHGLLDSIFGKQTKAYLVAVKWNFESGHYSRICGTEGETIEHTISSCIVLGQSEYKKRHDIFAKIIHMNLAVIFNLLKNTPPHYSCTPESCLKNDNYKLYFDRTVGWATMRHGPR
jgi:hypothetical protein